MNKLDPYEVTTVTLTRGDWMDVVLSIQAAAALHADNNRPATAEALKEVEIRVRRQARPFECDREVQA